MYEVITATGESEKKICGIAARLLKARDDEMARVDKLVEDQGLVGTDYEVRANTDALTRLLPLTDIVMQCVSCEDNGTMTTSVCAVQERAVEVFIDSVVDATRP